MGRTSDIMMIQTYLLMRWLGPDALTVVRLTRVYLLDFFCSGVQFILTVKSLSSLYLLLYPDLYVLGDDALIS